MGRNHQIRPLSLALLCAAVATAAASPSRHYEPDEHPPPLYPSAPEPYPPPSHPPPPPPPRYHPAPPHAAYPKCSVQEWSSDTELCTPELEEECEELSLRVRKITWPGFDDYLAKDCKPSKIPRCETNNDAQQFRLCTCRVKTHRSDLMATLYEQELVKRCDTYYVTECSYPPGYDAGKGSAAHAKCTTKPVKTCYDAPYLRTVQVPIKIKMAELQESCYDKLVPTPKTKCWDEEVALCANVPELLEREQRLDKCTHRVGEDRCQRVRLTIPREICYPAERYHPYAPPPPPPPHHPREPYGGYTQKHKQ